MYVEFQTTPAYVSSKDSVEPLTSSHLLTGRRLLSIPDESIVAEEESSDVEIITVGSVM